MSIAKWDALEWKRTEQQPVFFLRHGAMFFVNRDIATEQLLAIHRHNYYRTTEGNGMDWEIPIVDNASVLGKSAFGRNYIRKCCETWPGLADANATEFMPVLRVCHTIHVTLEPGSLATENPHELEKEMIICGFFDQRFQVRPQALDQNRVRSMQSSRELLEKLTTEVGPVFIVLDNIGWAFSDKNVDVFGKWKLFENFCRVILQSWLQISKVFFLIAGWPSFLRYTNQIPKAQGRYLMPIKFRRVSLHRLRRPEIEEIIHKTFIDKDEMKTIKTHFCLDDEQVVEVAGHLFNTTLGHPRSLAGVFEKCRSYEELVAYDLFDDRRCINWRTFADSRESWAKPLASMILVNLTQGWKDKDNREISYDAIAHFFDVSWDGTVGSATLYMPPYIQQLLLAFLCPLTEYLDKVANCQISLNYATILEWACLERFQDLFDEHSQGCPHKVLPEFFTEHQLFGMCTGVQFSKHTCPVPTATEKWTPETWWFMRTRIENRLGDEYRLDLKPRLNQRLQTYS